jgi:ABC-type branched-subunit amino acid transport system substrate-binding protein
VQGAADIMVLVEGLKRAGRDLTRESFVKAMETIKDYDEDGLSPPVTFGPDRHHGLNAVRLMRAVKASDGSIKQITPVQHFPPHF